MSIQFHDPRAEPLRPVEPYRLAARLDRPLTVGMLRNDFPDSGPFLQALEAALAAARPELRFRHYGKGNASIPAPEHLLETVVGECDVVVAAYGH